MAKVCGRVWCSAFTIIFVIIYSFNQSVAKNLNAELDFYDTSSSYLPEIVAALPVRLRARRDATTDPKNQYQAVNSAGAPAAAASSAAGAGHANDTVTTTVNGGTDASVTVAYNVHNVGVNGTGQRKDMLNTTVATTPTETQINVAAGTAANDGDGKKPLQVQYPKKVAASAPVTPAAPAIDQKTTAAIAGGITTTELPLIDEVDVSEELTEQNVKNHSLTRQDDHHSYYNSTMLVDKETAAKIWNDIKGIPHNTMLSKSHRRAMTVELKFDFPFYGHYVRNITVATGGFLYTGEYVHSWLAATQYIAPLMANFDTTLSNDSFVRMQDNETAFTVVWENAVLQDKPSFGKFTFSTTLHKNGDIVFAYFNIPITINAIQDTQHPVKVGLSDAYIIDKFLYFARRKTIYEYHRVTFSQTEITNSTLIYLTALPTCLGYQDCASCINHQTTFECVWCPVLNRCSTGTDRRKHEWMQKGCDRLQIKDSGLCPAIGQKGNNAAATNNNDNNSSAGGGSTDVLETTSQQTSSAAATSTPPNNNNAAGSSSSSSSTTLPPLLPSGQERKAAAAAYDLEHANETKSVGIAFGFLVPICLVLVVSMWLFYAYRNPHTRSGQLLIQFRPSQWSWRRGEARYTAATIHM